MQSNKIKSTLHHHWHLYSYMEGQKVISGDEPVMMLDSEDDVVRHKKYFDFFLQKIVPKCDVLKVAA